MVDPQRFDSVDDLVESTLVEQGPIAGEDVANVVSDAVRGDLPYVLVIVDTDKPVPDFRVYASSIEQQLPDFLDGVGEALHEVARRQRQG